MFIRFLNECLYDLLWKHRFLFTTSACFNLGLWIPTGGANYLNRTGNVLAADRNNYSTEKTIELAKKKKPGAKTKLSKHGAL